MDLLAPAKVQVKKTRIKYDKFNREIRSTVQLIKFPSN